MKKILAFTFGIITTVFSYAQTDISQNIEATYVCDVIVDYDQVIKTVPSQFRSQVAEPIKAEIANDLGLSQAQISRLEKSALSTIQNQLNPK